MGDRTVTIFVTVYNIEKHLDRFFECLSAQTYTDYEALLIDDGSTDGSLAVCQAHAAEDDRIRVVSTEHVGISQARNMAFDMIRTPYAASLDGDDYFDKDYLMHLMDAEAETHADMVLSNVIYVYEDGSEKERFPERPAGCYTAREFPDLIPALLEEERLNYLYAKLYKTALLKDVRVEPDVMQGSDTMINFMYLKNTKSIAVTEYYDYYYVQYQKRSVTSYAGFDRFMRLYRINKFVMDRVEEYGWMNDEMLRVIDGRIILSGYRHLNKLGYMPLPLKEKYRSAHEAINSDEYLTSYRRQEALGNLGTYRFPVIAPGKEKEYIDLACRVARENEQNRRRAKLRAACPDFIYELWHKTKEKLGVARKR